MSTRLQAEIRQRKPFRSPAEEVFLNLLRTTEALSSNVAGLLRPLGLSLPQYNVLRILRGAGAEGLSCNEIGERMVTRDSDITRLLDGLERRKLARRARDASDRRVIRAAITPAGEQLAALLDAPLDELLASQLAHMRRADLRQLADLLERARARPEG
jgi:DNA-binding MarR family transcriptional regulator